MADNYVHAHNAINAMKLINYTPRDYSALIWGANGPDPFSAYRTYSLSKKYDMVTLAATMHNEKTGLFLQNLFKLAQTDTQKDYCLGFLCHYSLDSVIHPLIDFSADTYSQQFNIPCGHSHFESALDLKIANEVYSSPMPEVNFYAPELSKIQFEQITALLKNATELTYLDRIYPKEEYLQAFKDFILVKKFFYSPTKINFVIAKILEKILKFKSNTILSHMQPNKYKIKDIPVWYNPDAKTYSVDDLDTLLKKADRLSSEYISVGLEYFKGKYNLVDFLEDVGNKSYITGVSI